MRDSYHIYLLSFIEFGAKIAAIYLKNYEKSKYEFNELDSIIIDDQLFNAAKKIKTSKTVYSDRIQNEMIKASVDILPTGFLKLSNIILQSGILFLAISGQFLML